jgi:hypothetical protein
MQQNARPEAVDFTQHNLMAARLWRDFDAGGPERVPSIFNIGTRFYLLTPGLNRQGYSFKQYFEDPAIQWEVQLSLNKWIRENVPQDQERGLPKEWPGLAPDFQNVYEAAWLGCKIEYREGAVPDTLPRLKGNKGLLAGMSIPHPLRDGLQGRAVEFYDYFEERRAREDFAGRPVGSSLLSAVGTDGPFTVACNLRGATELCLDLYEDPKFARELLDFITEAIIVRVKTVMDFNKTEYPQQGWWFADDCIELLSERQYREFILPCHQRLLSVFSRGGPNTIHICGNVQHLLPALQKELNIQDFELGFPVNLGAARKMLGPRATLRGNLHPQILCDGPVSLIREKTAEILQSGVKEGRRFIFCDGNNVAPETPLEHLASAYETALALGRYQD